MMACNLRSLLVAAIVLSNCITWTASRHHFRHNASGHRSRHRRQGAGLFLPASYVIPGGDGDGWGDWGEVSPCSRTCGGGVASQKRICLATGPEGPQCTGGDTKYFSCNTQDCPEGSVDFRAMQCSDFDDKDFRGYRFKWLPYTKTHNPCELNCQPHGERFYYRHKAKVVDGTRCNDDSLDVCVNGKCESVGCDMMLGSNAREDKCRECRGNGTSCHTMSDLFDSKNLVKGYNDILVIPEGSTFIEIEEIAPSINYLALRSTNGTYYLNGHYNIDFPRRMLIAGATWHYERSPQGFSAPDRLRCLGPTNEPLYLSLLLQDENVGIRYEYSVPNTTAPPPDKRYHWVFEKFTECSATCGGGSQTRNVTCRSTDDNELVENALCDEGQKLETNQTCNTDPCPPRWIEGPWGACSKRCGKGGVKSREVTCEKVIAFGYSSTVNDSECFDLLGPKPELFQKCNEDVPCPSWFIGRWKPCDKLCDDGKQTRQVVCRHKTDKGVEILDDKECGEKPHDQKPCFLKPCEGVDWVTTEWLGCDSCLSTNRTRQVLCVTKSMRVLNNSFCEHHVKPAHFEPCDKDSLPTCDTMWYASKWSKCSVECGEGVQTRKVFCGLYDGMTVAEVEDGKCAGQPKYNDTKPCVVPKEKCPAQWYASPWKACSKLCGGGERTRLVRCLKGDQEASSKDCDQNSVPDITEECNKHPCDTTTPKPVYCDELESVSGTSEFPEVGLDANDFDPDAEEYIEVGLAASEPDGRGDMGTATLLPFDTESFLPVNSVTGDLIAEGSGSGDGATTYEPETIILDFNDTATSLSEDNLMNNSSLDANDSSTTIAGDNVTTSSLDANDTSTTPAAETVTTSGLDVNDTSTTIAGDNVTTSGLDANDTSTTIAGDNMTTSSLDANDTSTTHAAETVTTSGLDVNDTSTTIAGDNVTTSGLDANDTSTTIAGDNMTTSSLDANDTSTTPVAETVTTSSLDANDTSTTIAGDNVTTSGLDANDTSTTIAGDNMTTSSLDANDTSTTPAAETVTTSSLDANDTSTTIAGDNMTTSNLDTNDTSTTTAEDNVTMSSLDTNDTSTTIAGDNMTTSSLDANDTTTTPAAETVTTSGLDANDTSTTIAGDNMTTSSLDANDTSTTIAGDNMTTSSLDANDTSTTIAGDNMTTSSLDANDTSTTIAGDNMTTSSLDANDTSTTIAGDNMTTSSLDANDTTTTPAAETVTTNGLEANDTSTTIAGDNMTTSSLDANDTSTTIAGDNETTRSLDANDTSTTPAAETVTTSGLDANDTSTTIAGDNMTTGGLDANDTSTTIAGDNMTTSSLDANDTTTTPAAETVTTSGLDANDTSTTIAGDNMTTISLDANDTSTTIAGDNMTTSSLDANDTSTTPAAETVTTSGLDANETSTTIAGDNMTTSSLDSNDTSTTIAGDNMTTSSLGANDTSTTIAGDNMTTSSLDANDTTTTPAAETVTTSGLDANDTSTTIAGDNMTTSSLDANDTSTTIAGDNETTSSLDANDTSTTPAAETVTTSGLDANDTSTTIAGDNMTTSSLNANDTATTIAGDNVTTSSLDANDTATTIAGDNVTTSSLDANDTATTIAGDNVTTSSLDANDTVTTPAVETVTTASTEANDTSTTISGDYMTTSSSDDDALLTTTESSTITQGEADFTGTGETTTSAPDGTGTSKIVTWWSSTPLMCIPRPSCQESPFKCCPDGKTPASGPFDEGCPNLETCENSKFGCCPDGLSPAEGANGEGCPPLTPCEETLYGCCPDNKTAATGNGNAGCPPLCMSSEYGCCSDNETEAIGPEKEGCNETDITMATTDSSQSISFSETSSATETTEVTGIETTSLNTTSSDTETSTINGTATATDMSTDNATETTQVATTESETSIVSETTIINATSSSQEVTDIIVTDASIATTVQEGCWSTEFGCCYDNETAAPAASGQGCPCNATEFGCCPDEESPAEGPGNEGCLGDCRNSEYGCCSDKQTPAHGPNNEGCCLLSAFGCCPDNVKPAEGPHLEGCGCRNSLYGCCPDGVTAAHGSDNLGCGCQYTEFGCCPNRHDEARGPDFEGCPCSSYQFGCCPDGVTVAAGPNQQGCHCRYSKYGCCSDGDTPAAGSDALGCDCAVSKYGCCPDGKTEATGPKFLGCSDVPKNKQAACTLPSDSGSCFNFSAYWYYDTTYGGCTRFWYGGCEGNGNRFATKEECEDVCVQPAPRDACKLPGVKGPCGAEAIRFYYNTTEEQCMPFRYGGCLGNANNFDSRELCQTQCEPDRTTDQCSLPIEHGVCAGNYSRWGYDKETHRCEQFTWGGCEGNSNRFKTEAACKMRCSPPGVLAPRCTQAQEAGTCTGKEALWSFSQSENRCVPFHYSGFGGNDNRFETRRDCEQTCPSAYEPDKCTLPASPGDCGDYRLQWFYNTTAKICHQFYYGGCGGNGNNFASEAECHNTCSEQQVTVITTKPTEPTPLPTTAQLTTLTTKPPSQASDKCSQASDVGDCDNYSLLWFYDQDAKSCRQFYYGGCGGNENRFATEEECRSSCPGQQVTTTTRTPEQRLRAGDKCSGKAETGSCYNYTLLWYYDQDVKSCRQFYYGGCGGNQNRFASEEECSGACDKQTTTVRPATLLTTSPVFQTEVPDHPDFCFLELDPGQCDNYKESWGYDSALGKCTTFQFGGCGGNRNNFPTEEYCNFYCHPVQDVCQLPMMAGPCTDSQMRWFYDANTDSCSQFTYGGCKGNDNRFESRDACESRCRSGPPTTTPTISTTAGVHVDVIAPECRISETLEACSNPGIVWYYDGTACVSHRNYDEGELCRKTGAFYSLEACERSCGAFRGVDVCAQRVDPGPCEFHDVKVYFDQASGECHEFKYGGCLGSANRFSTVAECRQVCKHKGTTTAATIRPVATTTPGLLSGSLPSDACVTPPSLEPCGERITVFYYDSELHQCVQSDNGGCGYTNMYRSEEECERQCGAFRELDVCGARLDPGRCRNAELKYYWNAAWGRCENFTYGGCEGGPNRFSSAQECQEICGHLAPDTSQNEVIPRPDCRRYDEECIQIQCNTDGIQRTYSSEGCIKCTCAPSPPAPDCTSQEQECQALVCPFGMKKLEINGCESCECYENPCDSQRCGAMERCEPVPTNDPYTAEERFTAQCKPEVPRAPEPDPQTQNQVAVSEGGKATLRCLFHGNPPPKITWRRGELTIDGSHSRYRLLSDGALEIVSVHRTDAGVYICVADNGLGIATQEVHLAINGVPNCERYNRECARLRCDYGKQRTPTADGCERCSCVPLEVDCTPLRIECEQLHCEYGMDRTMGDDGCPRCRCAEPPCTRHSCVSGERCVNVPYKDPITTTTRYNAECRTVLKPGMCPVDAGELDNECYNGCKDDADCPGVGKCCQSGCSRSCSMPMPPTTYAPEVPRAPEPDPQTQNQVAVSEGGKATLRCLFHGNPPPKITWRRGELTIDGNQGRYRLLSDGALEIVSLYRTDAGVYICVADNGLGIATQEVHLAINDPVPMSVGIAGEENAVVTGEIGRPLTIRCHAYGYPRPSVHWYHNMKMVPFNNPIYRMGRDNTLLIRSLAVETLGEYTCHAYNGEGKPASWVVKVKAYRPEGDMIMMVTRTLPQTTGGTTTTTSTTTTTTEMPILRIFQMPVNTHIQAPSGPLTIGQELQLPCEVDGFPEPEVYWSKDGQRIYPDGQRITITGSSVSRLTVTQLTTDDSGLYECHASNEYSSDTATAKINITQGVQVPAKCTDNPFFANCNLIVRNNFCRHKYYSKFCCKSCLEAGQIDEQEAELQADQPYKRK